MLVEKPAVKTDSEPDVESLDELFEMLISPNYNQVVGATDVLIDIVPSNHQAWIDAFAFMCSKSDLDPNARFHLAWMNWLGIGTAIDYTRAFNLWMSVSRAPYVYHNLRYASQVLVDLCDVSGYGSISFKATPFICNPPAPGSQTEPIFKLLFQWAKIAARRHWPGQLLLARCYLEGLGCPVQAKQGTDMVRIIALNDNAEAQLGLAILTREGRGTPQSNGECFFWIKSAADRGYAPAMCCLGNVFLEGEIVLQDLPKAFEWFNLASHCWNLDALYNLGGCYIDGVGVEKDLVKAAEVFMSAAKLGHAGSQLIIGDFLAHGHGVSADPVQAVTWFQRSSMQGCRKATERLAQCYFHGFGVPVDYQRSQALINSLTRSN